MIDLVFRCFSRARWVTVANNKGICDANGKAAAGFAIDEISSFVLSPGVIDSWFWVDLRIFGSQQVSDDADTMYPGEVEDGFKFTKSKLVAFVRNQSTPVTLTYKSVSVRTYQFGVGVNRIQLIDPRDYSSIRGREWLGGMEF